MIAMSVDGSGVYGIHGPTERGGAVDIVATVVFRYGAGGAVEVNGFAIHPGGTVGAGGINEDFAAVHRLGEDADAIIVLLAACGKECQQTDYDCKNSWFHYY